MYDDEMMAESMEGEIVQKDVTVFKPGEEPVLTFDNAPQSLVTASDGGDVFVKLKLRRSMEPGDGPVDFDVVSVEVLKERPMVEDDRSESIADMIETLPVEEMVDEA